MVKKDKVGFFIARDTKSSLDVWLSRTSNQSLHQHQQISNIHKYIDKNNTQEHLQRGAKEFFFRVSVHHPLQFDWQLFEGAGSWNDSFFAGFRRSFFGFV